MIKSKKIKLNRIIKKYSKKKRKNIQKINQKGGSGPPNYKYKYKITFEIKRDTNGDWGDANLYEKIKPYEDKSKPYDWIFPLVRNGLADLVQSGVPFLAGGAYLGFSISGLPALISAGFGGAVSVIGGGYLLLIGAIAFAVYGIAKYIGLIPSKDKTNDYKKWMAEYFNNVKKFDWGEENTYCKKKACLTKDGGAAEQVISPTPNIYIDYNIINEVKRRIKLINEKTKILPMEKDIELEAVAKTFKTTKTNLSIIDQRFDNIEILDNIWYYPTCYGYNDKSYKGKCKDKVCDEALLIPKGLINITRITDNTYGHQIPQKTIWKKGPKIGEGSSGKLENSGSKITADKAAHIRVKKYSDKRSKLCIGKWIEYENDRIIFINDMALYKGKYNPTINIKKFLKESKDNANKEKIEKQRLERAMQTANQEIRDAEAKKLEDEERLKKGKEITAARDEVTSLKKALMQAKAEGASAEEIQKIQDKLTLAEEKLNNLDPPTNTSTNKLDVNEEEIYDVIKKQIDNVRDIDLWVMSIFKACNLIKSDTTINKTNNFVNELLDMYQVDDKSKHIVKVFTDPPHPERQQHRTKIPIDTNNINSINYFINWKNTNKSGWVINWNDDTIQKINKLENEKQMYEKELNEISTTPAAAASPATAADAAAATGASPATGAAATAAATGASSASPATGAAGAAAAATGASSASASAASGSDPVSNIKTKLNIIKESIIKLKEKKINEYELKENTEFKLILDIWTREKRGSSRRERWKNITSNLHKNENDEDINIENHPIFKILNSDAIKLKCLSLKEDHNIELEAERIRNQYEKNKNSFVEENLVVSTSKEENNIKRIELENSWWLQNCYNDNGINSGYNKLYSLLLNELIISNKKQIVKDFFPKKIENILTLENKNDEISKYTNSIQTIDFIGINYINNLINEGMIGKDTKNLPENLIRKSLASSVKNKNLIDIILFEEEYSNIKGKDIKLAIDLVDGEVNKPSNFIIAKNIIYLIIQDYNEFEKWKVQTLTCNISFNNNDLIKKWNNAKIMSNIDLSPLPNEDEKKSTESFECINRIIGSWNNIANTATKTLKNLSDAIGITKEEIILDSKITFSDFVQELLKLFSSINKEKPIENYKHYIIFFKVLNYLFPNIFTITLTAPYVKSKNFDPPNKEFNTLMFSKLIEKYKGYVGYHESSSSLYNKEVWSNIIWLYYIAKDSKASADLREQTNMSQYANIKESILINLVHKYLFEAIDYILDKFNMVDNICFVIDDYRKQFDNGKGDFAKLCNKISTNIEYIDNSHLYFDDKDKNKKAKMAEKDNFNLLKKDGDKNETYFIKEIVSYMHILYQLKRFWSKDNIDSINTKYESYIGASATANILDESAPVSDVSKKLLRTWLWAQCGSYDKDQTAFNTKNVGLFAKLGWNIPKSISLSGIKVIDFINIDIFKEFLKEYKSPYKTALTGTGDHIKKLNKHIEVMNDFFNTSKNKDESDNFKKIIDKKMYTINYLNNNFNHKKIEMHKYSKMILAINMVNPLNLPKDITKTITADAAADTQKYIQQLFDENDDLSATNEIDKLSGKVVAAAPAPAAAQGGGGIYKYHKIEVE